MKPSRLYVVRSNDWEGVYLDGDLLREEHSIPKGILMGIVAQYEIKKDEFAFITLGELDIAETELNGCFPKKLSEFKDISQISRY